MPFGTFLMVLSSFGSVAVVPVSKDPAIAISLVAREPAIVTPTGVAVDGAGRVLVVESHTHFRPQGYQGPTHDRILSFSDEDKDGGYETRQLFFEGTRHTMNIAVGPDDWIYLATRADIRRLRDQDGDRRADQIQTLLTLKTSGNYPHNGLSGFAFDDRGRVYVGLGENLGADYELIGTDGAKVKGGGEGGGIFRCDLEGRNVERVATGFWNPFHLCFDVYGRLFAVDNDPDSRPPCRLLHVVEGGDYGYRFRNGRKGLHPFTAWDGELPGTLPMVAGTGEAPSGVIECPSHSWGGASGKLLVTSWGDHRIDAFELRPKGASVTGERQELIKGNEDFRPVGIALGPDGSLFVTDWVKRDYELHGYGRLWRLQSRPSAEPEHSPSTLTMKSARSLASTESGRAQLVELFRKANTPSDRAVLLRALLAVGDTVGARLARDSSDPRLRALAARESHGGVSPTFDKDPFVRAEQIRALRDKEAPTDEHLIGVLEEAMASDDPFLAQSARFQLRNRLTDEPIVARWRSLAPRPTATKGQPKSSLDQDPRRVREARRGWTILLSESDTGVARALLPELLEDDDETARFLAIKWVAERRIAERRALVEKALESPGLSEQLFEACLVGLELLDGRRGIEFDTLGGKQLLTQMLVDGKAKGAVLTRAIRAIPPSHPFLTRERFITWTAPSAPVDRRLEAVRTLRLWTKDPRRANASAATKSSRSKPDSVHKGENSSASDSSSERENLLLELAHQADVPRDVRLEVIAGLDPGRAEHHQAILDALSSTDPLIVDEALRALQGAPLNDATRSKLIELKNRSVLRDSELLDRLLTTAREPRPEAGDPAGWVRWLGSPGDPVAGERLFFHPKRTTCARCHEVDGRGGRIGPALSHAPSRDPEKLLSSMLQPSREIAPKFVLWSIVQRDGAIASGVIVKEDNSDFLDFGDAKGEVFTVRKNEIERMTSQRTSLMPDSLLDPLTKQEIRDLWAFLIRRP